MKVTVMEGDLPIDTSDCGTCVFPSQKLLSLQDYKLHITLDSDLIKCLILLGSPCYVNFRLFYLPNCRQFFIRLSCYLS